MTRTAGIAGIACAIAAAGAGESRADSIATSGAAVEGNGVVELSHVVEVEIADRTATFRVERELANTSGVPVKYTMTIDLPTRAVARSFRVLSGDRWIDANLVGVEAAEAAWEKLTTTGEQREHGPVLLEWLADGQLSVREYPMAAGAHRRLAYTLDAPVCFAKGRWIADYPPAADDLAPVQVRGRARVFTSAQLGAELGESVDEACGADVQVGGDRFLVVDAPSPAPADVRFAQASTGTAAVVRMSIDVANEIAPAPKDARVVFVVDASRSMGDVGVAQQLAWIGGYLAHVPDASFEIVLYRRWPERLFGRFVPARAAAARLAAIDPIRLRPGNGSHLDRGLEVAAQLLVPAGSPRRVVAFTDERWRPSFTADQSARALDALPADAIVHLIDLSPDATDAPPSIERADDDELAPSAARWGGIAATVAGGALAPHGEFAAAALVLVRPLHIDHVVLHRGAAGDDGDTGTDDLGDLVGGTGIYRAWRARDSSSVYVDGMIWGRPWRHQLVADPVASRRWAGEVIADPLRTSLADPEILALATTASVVSPMTSFLAVDPRHPPAAAPDWGEGGCGCDDTFGTIGGGSVSTGTSCDIGIGTREATPDPSLIAAMIAPRADACAAQHHQRRWDLAVGVDTTGFAATANPDGSMTRGGAEIVDVQVRARIVDGEPLPPAGAARDADLFEACVEDAAWDVALDDRFARFTHHYDARVSGSR